MRPVRFDATRCFVLVPVVLLLAGCSRTRVTPAASATPPPAERAVLTPARTGPSADRAVESPLREADLVPVFFAYDSHTLDDRARAALDANASALRTRPNATITIEGHCDERGTVEYNQALGERRAAAARDYLIRAGIDGARISVVSLGKERPFVTGDGEESWAQNRRAHFVPR